VVGRGDKSATDQREPYSSDDDQGETTALDNI
jgi:hypothetical protein